MPFSAARVEVSRIRERAVRDERRRRVDRCFQLPVPAQHEEVRDVDEPLRLLAPPRRLELVQLGDVLDHGGQPVPVRGGPLGQQLDAARPLEAHQRSPKEPRCRGGGRGSISGGCSRLR